jgi:hypothetical protein
MASNSGNSSASHGHAVTVWQISRNWIHSDSDSVRLTVTLRLVAYCQLVRLGANSLETHGRYIFSTEHLQLYSLCNILSDERISLPLPIAADPSHRSHSQVWVLQESWPYFTVADFRLHQHGGPGPHTYIPQEQVGPVVPPGTGFPFCRLQLAGLRQWYLNPPPHVVELTQPAWSPHYVASGRTQQKTPPPTVFLLLLWVIA